MSINAAALALRDKSQHRSGTMRSGHVPVWTTQMMSPDRSQTPNWTQSWGRAPRSRTGKQLRERSAGVALK